MEIWQEIGFSPTSFIIPEKELEDEDVNFGGDQRILNLANFPRQVNHPALPEADDEKFSKAKINNFPKEQTDAEVLSFLNDKVDKSISLTDLEILRSTSSTQIILGPGPSKAIVLKAIELDWIGFS